ncbi:MAG: choice-of-anchor D domain-containing protein [Verrucomicrobia bacterium]|nr:choice-of-anchor D domain-containing protein [Verrucomicrobiota bacterium]
MPTSDEYSPLPGSERPPVSGAVVIGPVERNELVSATLRLRPRPDAPAEPDLEHWQQAAAHGRRFLSVGEYMETYGSSVEEAETVSRWLTSKGLSIIETDAGRRRIVVEGTAAKINAAFGIKLNWYRAPDRRPQRPRLDQTGNSIPLAGERELRYRGFEGPVHLATQLIGVVVAVIGLDNRQVGGPAAVGTGDPPNSNYLSPTAVAQLYGFPNTGASGSTIGIFEDAASGAAYLHSDITSFVASLPAGYNTPPILNDIGLTVGATTYSNNPALVTSSPSNAVGECCIDVSIAAAVAQGANINVYFTENSEAGWEAFLNRAIFPPAGDSAPSVLSASWLLNFRDDSGAIGSYATPGTTANVLSGLLQAAATRGITVLMAIGDWGSANQVLDGQCHVSYPNCDPWTTACGGTIVGNISGPPTRFLEFVWSDANIPGSPFQGFPFVATGGGVSDNFPVPPYQNAAGVQPISKNDGNPRRGVPDVAGMIAMDGFFFAGVGGPGQYPFIGTSLVAPLYAGLVAVIAKFLGRDVGFLNPILYSEGPAICRDTRFGDNESGNPSPDAPVYIAGPGWDACTGWGSLAGLRLLAALGPAPLIVTAVGGGGNFGDVCSGSFADQILTINNTGFSLLLVSDINSSAADFLVSGIAAYPLAISPGASIDVVIRFQPTSIGLHTATLTVHSNALFGPHTLSVSGLAPAPRLVAVIAGNGAFPRTCLGSFADEPIALDNAGRCVLSITDITSSSADFVPADVLSYPIVIGPGASLQVPVRFRPASLGAKSATLTITSNDPSSPLSLAVKGDVPAGRLAVTGSTYFGGVPACSKAERTISLCNVGDCKLHVAGVSFRHKNRHWRLLNNPFPADLHPGSSLSLVILYHAAERSPRSCDLVIHSDDPVEPIKMIPVVAHTVWPECGCSQTCEDCRKGCCQKHKSRCCPPVCEDDCEDEEEEELERV